MEKRLGKIFCVLSITLFAVLFFYSIVGTWINDYDLVSEYVHEQQDSLLGNTLWLGIVLLGSCLLYQLGRRCKLQINMDIVAAVVCLLACAFSVYWVSASATAPQADQLLICTCAEEFENGNYERLGRGQYAGLFRHQLGQITFMRLLFKVFGNGNYQAFQYFNALMVPLLIFSGFQIVKRVSADSKIAQVFYLLLMAACVPLYCYIPFVYGEMVSTALVMFAAWMLLASFEKFSMVRIALMSIALGGAVQFRKNALIFVIAFLIVAMIHLFRGWSRQMLITIAGILLGVALLQAYITGTYQKLIPEDSPKVPSAVYIAMGANDDNGMAGWHNYFDQIVFAENNYDTEATNQAVGEYLLAFGKKCMGEPGYAVDFYYRKIGSQWNAPMYQCLAMNNIIEGEQSEFVENVYFGNLRELVEAEMNIYQLVIYGAVFCLLLFVRKKWQKIDNYLLLIAVFGGFLFSIMWEAKPRYVFPYFLMMIPYAAAGLCEIVKWLHRKCREYFRKDGAL